MLWLILVASALAFLVGCGGLSGTEWGAAPCVTKRERSQPKKPLPVVDITLNGKDGPENSSVLMAAKCGYFAEAGFNVTVTSPGGMNYPLYYVATETVQIGISNEPQVAIATAKGVPVVAIGSLVAAPTAALIWLQEAGIDGIADLKGKTIAIPGVPFQKEFLQVALAHAGLSLADVDIDVVGYDLMAALTEGKADAIFGGSANLEGAALKARGLKPVVIPIQELGIPDYDELVVIANPKFARENPRLIQNFMAALSRGRAVAVADPARVRQEMEGSAEAYELTRAEREAEISATLPLLSESPHLDPQRVERLADWMYREGITEGRARASGMLTNRYLAVAEES